MTKLLTLATAFCTFSCGQTLTAKSVEAAALRQGAGFVFVCRDDPSILLAKRSKHVSEPGTWSSIGGMTEPGETPEETAVRETKEEAGSMPKVDRILARLRYEKDGFVFVTFIANLSREEKRRWRTKRNFENDEITWLRELPDNLHPGLKAALEEFVNGNSNA